MTAITKNFYNGQFDITKMTVFLTQMAVMKPKLQVVLPKMTVHWTKMTAKVRLVMIKALIRPWPLETKTFGRQ